MLSFFFGKSRQSASYLEMVPDLIEKKKFGRKDLPTEVFIKKKRQYLF